MTIATATAPKASSAKSSARPELEVAGARVAENAAGALAVMGGADMAAGAAETAGCPCNEPWL